jgi:hypothetical protein
MSSLRTGQEVVLSWSSGATDCHVVAAAGAFVLLRPQRAGRLLDGVPGPCTLTFLDGMVPMGWDGDVEFGSVPGELRFRVEGGDRGADRRSSVRLPIFATIEVTAEDRTYSAQMLDVSAGGMRYRAPIRPAVGAAVRVRTRLPGEGPEIDADAVVRLSEPGGVVAVEYTGFRAGSPQDIGGWTVAQLRRTLGART